MVEIKSMVNKKKRRLLCCVRSEVNFDGLFSVSEHTADWPLDKTDFPFVLQQI
jgi:hypothetical protein